MSAHPAFPAIVGMWFAVLLGLGSLIVPVAVLERLVGMIGIAGVIPAAAPPLGLTARIAIALVAALFGAGLGFAAARRIGLRNRQAHDGHEAFVEDDDADTLDLISISTGEEMRLDEGEVMEPHDAATPRRRRPLTIAEDDGPSDILNVAPLPGEIATGAAYDQYQDVEGFADAEPVDVDEPDEYGLDEYGQEVDEPPLEMVATFGADGDLGVEDEDEIAAEAEVEEPNRADLVDTPPPLDITQGAVLPGATDTDGRQPLPFSPPSLARAAGDEDDPATDEDLTATDDDTSEVEELSDMPTTATHKELHHDRSDRLERSADLGELGLVQLVQRLGSVLEEHREWSARRAAALQPPAPVTASVDARVAAKVEPQDELVEPFTPAAPEEAADAMAAYFSQPAAEAEPDVTESAGEEPREASDGHATAQPAEAPGTPDRDASYRSLSIVDNPFKPMSDEAEAEKEPTAPSAPQGRRAPVRADNDEILREALLNLQHMAE